MVWNEFERDRFSSSPPSFPPPLPSLPPPSPPVPPSPLPSRPSPPPLFPPAKLSNKRTCKSLLSILFSPTRLVFQNCKPNRKPNQGLMGVLVRSRDNRDQLQARQIIGLTSFSRGSSCFPAPESYSFVSSSHATICRLALTLSAVVSRFQLQVWRDKTDQVGHHH